MRRINTVALGLTFIGLVSFASLTPNEAYAGEANSGSQSGAISQSGANVVFGQSHKGVGNAIAPGLIAGGITCAGSTAVAGGWMGGAISFGMTTMDKDCNTRENAKMFGIMQDKAMAIEIMCDSKQVLEADRRLGRYLCSQNRRVQVLQKEAKKTYSTSTVGYGFSNTKASKGRKLGLSARLQ